MDFTVLILLTILLIPLHHLFKLYLKRKKIADAIDPLGGDKWYPIVGTYLRLIKASREELYDAFSERNRIHGPLFRSWMGFIPSIHIMKAEHIEPIISGYNNLTKGQNYRFMKPWLGEGLISGDGGDQWRHHRKLLTPTFHFSILDTMNDVFTEKAGILVDVLTEKADGKFFNIYNYLSCCALDIICETAMGVEIGAMKHSDSPYVKAVFGVTDLILYRTFHPYLHSDFIFNLTKWGREHKKCLDILHGFTRKVIQERKELINSGRSVKRELSKEDESLGKKQRLAFLDLLLEANKKENGGLTDEEIREEVDTFMFAGHDTTTGTVAWTLFLLGNHPEIQEKLHQELDEFYGDEEPQVQPQDFLNLPYLERVIKESQRVLPIIPVIARGIDTPVKLGDREIPPGVVAVIHLDCLHKDPEQYPNPERFDPDNFLPENVSKRHKYSFLPFSAGPRNCLGQKFAMRNIKVLLITILRRFKVTSQKRQHEMKYYLEMALRPQGDLGISLEKRHQKK